MRNSSNFSFAASSGSEGRSAGGSLGSSNMVKHGNRCAGNAAETAKPQRREGRTRTFSPQRQQRGWGMQNESAEELPPMGHRLGTDAKDQIKLVFHRCFIGV